MVKLSVSKTELLGSNPSAPAIFPEDCNRRADVDQILDVRLAALAAAVAEGKEGL
jgi:hypothetical protein